MILIESLSLNKESKGNSGTLLVTRGSMDSRWIVPYVPMCDYHRPILDWLYH